MRQTSLVARRPGGGFTVRLSGSRSPAGRIQAGGVPRVSRSQLDAIDRGIPPQRDADDFPVVNVNAGPDLAAVRREQQRAAVMGNWASAQPTTPDNVLDDYYPREWLPEVWG